MRFVIDIEVPEGDDPQMIEDLIWEAIEDIGEGELKVIEMNQARSPA